MLFRSEDADVAFAMVAFPKDVEEVFLGARGLLAAGRLPRVVVDMGTSPPALARRIAEVAALKGVGALDAPVSGGALSVGGAVSSATFPVSSTGEVAVSS